MTLRRLIGIRSPVKRFTITLLACVCIAAIEMPAMAQQAPPASPDTPELLQEIVVTGSMIKRPNAETAEAVTILKTDALKDQGIENVKQGIKSLTSPRPPANIAA